ncbi:MAG: spondin domain-containing protein [Pseudomonadota bacterium]
MRTLTFLPVALLATALPAFAAATTLEITVTSSSPAGGLSVTPLYVAFHDGTVDLFDEGGVASPGIELVAEEGVAAGPGSIAAERLAIDADSQGLILATSTGAPPIEPGETTSGTLDVDGENNRFFSFFSMILPSNDTFIGVDDPLTYEIFDADGNFLGPIDISVTGEDIYDAGTEANDFTNGPAFVQGQDINDGGPGEGTIEQGVGLGLDTIPFGGLTLATGAAFNSAFAGFISDPANFPVLEISIREVGAPIPTPATALLLVSGLGGMLIMRRRRA